MEFLYRFFPEAFIEAMGWTLFHSLWQGAILTILLIVVLLILKKSRAQIRYLVSLILLITLFVWAGVTFHSSYKYAREKQQLKKDLILHPEQVIGAMQEKIHNPYNAKITTATHNQIKWIRFRAFMQRNFPVVFMLWLLGVLLFMTRMAGGILYMQNLRRRQTLPIEEYWTGKIEEMKNRLGIRRGVEAVQSMLIKVPMVLGYIKPVVLFPVTFFTGLSEEELEAVIAHELAHIRRHDYLLNIIQSIIETLFFFHPAVWLISKNIRDEREHCCDELAIGITGDRVAYMKALAFSQELVIKKQNQYALTFSTGGGSLLKRIKRIKNQNTMKNKVPEGFIAASLIFISVVLLSFSIDNRKLSNEFYHDFRSGKATKLGDSALETVDTVVLDDQPDITTITDSITTEMEGLETLPEEMEQLAEMAYTEHDHELALLILESVELAMSQVNIELENARIEMENARIEMENERMERENARIDTENARIERESQKIAEEAIRIAAETIDAIDIDEIVRVAMHETRVALQSIDIETIQREALEETKRALEEANAAIEELNQEEEWDEGATEENPDIKNEKYNSMEEQLDELER